MLELKRSLMGNEEWEDAEAGDGFVYRCTPHGDAGVSFRCGCGRRFYWPGQGATREEKWKSARASAASCASGLRHFRECKGGKD